LWNSATDKPVTNGVRVNADIYQELLRQDVVSWFQRRYPDREYVSSRFSGSSHCQNLPAVLGGILDPGRLTTLFAGHEPAGLLYLLLFAVRSLSDASC
jgi:hypothetical protein